MGNTNGHHVNGHHVVCNATTDSNLTVGSLQVSPQPVSPQPVPTLPQSVPKAPYKKSNYVHPFIELINRNASEDEIIGTLSVFMCSIPIGTDENGRPIYEEVDQLSFLIPVTQVFAYAANNGKKNLTKWLMENFVPLRVSEDNNFCYFESLRWKHDEIADMIASHESFVPTMTTLYSLMSRGKYDIFKRCMSSPHLTGDMMTYRFTLSNYIDNSKYQEVNDLLQKIKSRDCGRHVDIIDPIMPNPRLVPKVTELTTAIAEPSEDELEKLEKYANDNPISSDIMKQLTECDVIYTRSLNQNDPDDVKFTVDLTNVNFTTNSTTDPTTVTGTMQVDATPNFPQGVAPESL